MARPVSPNTNPVVVDPNKEPVKVINMVTFHGPEGGLCDVSFCTVQRSPDGRGRFSKEAVIASRLRFDIEMARAIRDGLNRQLELADTPAPRPN